MKISIIIPAYNVEKYIDSCLTSVVRQDLPLSDYEIVIVNDGSTDSTYTKIVDFAKNYPNIVIINKSNEGLGATRNRGLDESCGEYVMFLDSDDTIMENCLASIYSHMKDGDLDILEFDFSYIDEDGKDIVPKICSDGNYQRPLNVITSGREYLLYSDYFIPMVCMRAYRRELLIKNNIYMIPYKHEDENFTPIAYYYAKRVKIIDVEIYKYLKHNDSIMNTYNTRNLFDTVTSIGMLQNFITENIPEDDVQLHEYFRVHNTNILSMIYIRSINEGFNVERKLIVMMKKYNIYPFDIKKYKKYKMVYDLSATLFIPYYRRKLSKLNFIRKNNEN